MRSDADYDMLDSEQQMRLAALRCVRDALPELDVWDLQRLSHWVLTGQDVDADVPPAEVTE